MKIYVKAKIRAKETRIKKLDDVHYEIAVKEPPSDGRANKAIIDALAEYLEIPRSRVKIISGHTSRQKILEVVGI